MSNYAPILPPPFSPQKIGFPKKFCLQKFFGKRRKRGAHLLFALCANSVKRSDFRRRGGGAEAANGGKAEGVNHNF